MSGFRTTRTFYQAAQSTTLVTVSVSAHLSTLKRCFHSGSNNPHFCSSDQLSPKAVQRNAPKHVGVFWDLDNKPPKSFPPFQVANRLKAAASSFGIVRYMVAYANRHAFTHVPQVVRKQRNDRKVLNQLENKGILKPVEPYFCGVCGRRFYNNEKLVNHFRQIHEREQKKRLNQIDSAKGKMRVKLVAKFSVKMEKYRNAAKDILTPKVGYSLAGELERAGFWVRAVSNKPQAADDALRAQMVDMMDRRRVECVVLVSDDSDFVDVLKEARLRCVNTVVVGDSNDGALKRTADAGFSWEEIMLGKAKKKAVTVVDCWKDSDILKRLEWTYSSEMDDEKSGSVDQVGLGGGDTDIEDIFEGGEDDFVNKIDKGDWWELESSAESSSVNSF